jgi:predicted NBD/HSP70 family sugar kinase
MRDFEQIALPGDPNERLNWIKNHVLGARVAKLGVSTGGTVDPNTRTVWEAKPIIPGHVGTDFSSLAPEVFALNDGLATAWGHAWHPTFAGLKVATLALGTGVGCGFVSDGNLLMGRRGEYSRLNDHPSAGGDTYENLLGGAALSRHPGETQRRAAQAALEAAVSAIRGLYLPDVVVICGGVGLAEWLVLPEGVVRTPYGEQAGLWGAAALARYPAR